MLFYYKLTCAMCAQSLVRCLRKRFCDAAQTFLHNLHVQPVGFQTLMRLLNIAIDEEVFMISSTFLPNSWSSIRDCFRAI